MMASEPKKLVLFDPRSEQITLCQGRWYHYNCSARNPLCPLCRQPLPSMSQQPVSCECAVMQRNYFLLLDRSHASDAVGRGA